MQYIQCRIPMIKSPITETADALGAHTAKRTPFTPSTVTIRASSFHAALTELDYLNKQISVPSLYEILLARHLQLMA